VAPMYVVPAMQSLLLSQVQSVRCWRDSTIGARDNIVVQENIDRASKKKITRADFNATLDKAPPVLGTPASAHVRLEGKGSAALGRRRQRPCTNCAAPTTSIGPPTSISYFYVKGHPPSARQGGTPRHRQIFDVHLSPHAGPTPQPRRSLRRGPARLDA